MKEDRQFVTALSRGLEVLRCFSPARQVLSATEIAARIGLPQPTVWRLCHTLVATGYLVAAPSGKLRIGAPVLTLGYAAIASLDYLQIIRPHMQQLADRYGGSVCLAERHRSKMIYVEVCKANTIVSLNLQVGARLSIHNTATGWAWLAALTPERRQAALERLNGVFGEAWAPHQANIDRAAIEYEQHGFVTNDGSPITTVRAIALPIIGPDGRPLQSLNFAGPTGNFTEALMTGEIAPALIQLGKMLEAQLAVGAPSKKTKRRD